MDKQINSYVCVPMVAQGESIGVLHIQDPAFSSPLANQELQRKKASAITLAEQVSLALANLKLRETLKNQSVRDPLTGLFNRRHMEESLEREIQRAARHGKQVSVMMLDLDHFKDFNDTFGHEAGDIFLREIGALLAAKIRGEDIACRYGGEEFILILADVASDVACERAAMLVEQVRNLQIQQRGTVLRRVTVSIGVAAFPGDGTSASQVINAADKALYEAKAAGRDRIVVAEALSS